MGCDAPRTPSPVRSWLLAAPSPPPPAYRAPNAPDWRAKAAAADVPCPALLRQAMPRTRTWTASAVEVERERTRQVARIGRNLNRIAPLGQRVRLGIQVSADCFEKVTQLVSL